MSYKKIKPLRALFIGFGHVGQQIARILTRERDNFPGLASLDLKTIAIIGRSKGNLVNEKEGVDLRKALDEVEEMKTFSSSNPDRRDISALEAARSLDYDVLIELSNLSSENRGEPAISHIRSALERGRHAITANKGPVAFAYSELKGLAEKMETSLLYETTVMDGAPVFNMARCCLKGCTVKGIEGILNSTTNFVLSRMEEGQCMDDAVKEAQRIGIAEADPNYDLEGWDSSAKISILANALMGASISPFHVDRKGIAGLSTEDVEKTLNSGKRLKLICKAWLAGKDVRASVKLEEIPSRHHFNLVMGSGSVITIETDLMGPIVLTQQNPTLYDTAYGVLSDLMTLSSTMETGVQTDSINSLL